MFCFPLKYLFDTRPNSGELKCTSESALNSLLSKHCHSCWYCLSILEYLSIQAKFADIDDVGYNINIETTIMFLIPKKVQNLKNTLVFI